MELRQLFDEQLGITPPSGPSMTLLLRLLALYQEKAVVDGLSDPPLWDVCACARSCWGKLPLSYRPGRSLGDPWRGGIPLPWIGPHYRTGGVVVLGVNLNHASGLLVEYDIALNGPLSQLGRLRAGKRNPHGSQWAYRSLRSAAAVVRSLRGLRPLDERDPSSLADVLLETARLQAVKCSPKDALRSSRTLAMRANCPPMFLRYELEILDPVAVVAFGDETWNALGSVADLHVTTDGPHVWRAVINGSPDREVFWLPHPASYGHLWPTAHKALIRSLTHRPALGRHDSRGK